MIRCVALGEKIFAIRELQIKKQLTQPFPHPTYSQQVFNILLDADSIPVQRLKEFCCLWCPKI